MNPTATTRLARVRATAARLAASWAADTLLIAGAVAVAYGARLVYVPAGYIVGGLLLIMGGALAARRGD